MTDPVTTATDPSLPGSSLIDRLRADFDKRRTEVEVLGMTIFVTPLTLTEQMKINAKHPDDGALRFAEMLVLKCKDAAGKPVFTVADKSILSRVIAADRLSAAISAITGPGPEALGKD